MSTPEVKLPGPDHPITIHPAGERVLARVGDELIADTRDALSLREASYPEVLYIPFDDVRPEVLRPSDTKTHCPYKGDASYYDLLVGGKEMPDAVWSYRQPHDAVAEIAGHVAFYPDRVQVSAEG